MCMWEESGCVNLGFFEVRLGVLDNRLLRMKGFGLGLGFCRGCIYIVEGFKYFDFRFSL